MALTIGQMLVAMVLAFILLVLIIACANVIHWYGRQRTKSKASPQKAGPEDFVVPPDQFILLRVLADKDGHASLSTLQFLLWTLLIAFLYITLWFLQLLSGSTTAPPAIDPSLMALLGISLAVPITSKGISEYKRLKPRNEGETYREPDYGSMLEENGQPSLLRVQMFLWTIAALVIFTGQFLVAAFAPAAGIGSFGLPAIDPTLLFLMGLSQTGYLGNKAYSGTVTTNGKSTTPASSQRPPMSSSTTTPPATPVKQPLAIREVIPRSVQAKDPVTLLGSGFGMQKDTLTLGQTQIPETSITRWEDTRIDFVIPASVPAGACPIRVIAGGNAVGEQITVTAPTWAQDLNEIDAEIKGDIWIDDPSQRNYRCPPIGYFLPGKRYHFFYEFEVTPGTPAWGLTQFRASFYVDGVKIRNLSVLPGYINGQNYGVFDYVFEAEKTYRIEIRGCNTAGMDVPVKRR
jgi:hypothetical protein